MNDAIAYITKRFDRKNSNKFAVEDLCQLTGLLTEQKYRASHELVGKTIKRVSGIPGDDVLRYFELVVFSYLIGNNDMHLKNFSMITADPARIILSPAYHLLAMRLILTEKDDPEQMALTINGKKNKLNRIDFLTLANSH